MDDIDNDSVDDGVICSDPPDDNDEAAADLPTHSPDLNDHSPELAYHSADLGDKSPALKRVSHLDEPHRRFRYLVEVHGDGIPNGHYMYHVDFDMANYSEGVSKDDVVQSYLCNTFRGSRRYERASFQPDYMFRMTDKSCDLLDATEDISESDQIILTLEERQPYGTEPFPRPICLPPYAFDDPKYHEWPPTTYELQSAELFTALPRSSPPVERVYWEPHGSDWLYQLQVQERNKLKATRAPERVTRSSTRAAAATSPDATVTPHHSADLPSADPELHDLPHTIPSTPVSAGNDPYGLQSDTSVDTAAPDVDQQRWERDNPGANTIS